MLHIDALNHAVRDILPESMRMHLCWGNDEGPHHLDTPLREACSNASWRRTTGSARHRRGESATRPRVDGVSSRFHCRRTGRSLPACWTRRRTSSNIRITSPLRLEQLAFDCIGRERVTAGTDCASRRSRRTACRSGRSHGSKLAAMVEGARIASTPALVDRR